MRDFVEAGGLISYGVSFVELHPASCHLRRQILKGVKLADLPIE